MSYYLASCGHTVPITCPECDRPPGGVTDPQLAVLMRQTQWALDEAAHDLPAGRITSRRRKELATTLQTLSAIVRTSVPAEIPASEPADRAGPGGRSTRNG